MLRRVILRDLMLADVMRVDMSRTSLGVLIRPLVPRWAFKVLATRKAPRAFEGLCSVAKALAFGCVLGHGRKSNVERRDLFLTACRRNAGATIGLMRCAVGA
jgi:hypothetical protein